jgi:hypothetical protein
METLQEIEKAPQKEDDVPEVSYTLLVTNHKDPSDILQQVADSAVHQAFGQGMLKRSASG